MKTTIFKLGRIGVLSTMTTLAKALHRVFWWIDLNEQIHEPKSLLDLRCAATTARE